MKYFYLGATQPRRIVGSFLKAHPPLLFKLAMVTGMGKEGLLPLFNYLAAFWHGWVLSIHLSSFGHVSVSTKSSTVLANGKTPQSSLSMVTCP